MSTLTIKMAKWDIEEETGYKPFTTFWQAIQETFNRAFDAWKGNYKYLTELVLVLNHKIFYYYVQKGTDEQNEIALLYNKLYQRANIYALDNLQGEEANYFYRVTN